MAGEAFATLSVVLDADTGKLKKGLTETKKAVIDTEKEVTKSNEKVKQDFKKTYNAIGEDLERGGSALTKFGLLAVGTIGVLKAAGVNLGPFEGAINGIGLALVTAGSAAQIAASGVKAYATAMVTQLQPAVMGLYAAIGPAGWFLIGIGALAAALSIAYSKTKDLELAFKDLTNAKKDYLRIGADLGDLELDLKEAIIDEAEAAKSLNEAYATGDKTKIAQAEIRAERAKRRIGSITAQMGGLAGEQQYLAETYPETARQAYISAAKAGAVQAAGRATPLGGLVAGFMPWQLAPIEKKEFNITIQLGNPADLNATFTNIEQWAGANGFSWSLKQAGV